MNIQKSLDRLENLFDGLFEWLAGQYDDRTGGFFYARSSKVDPQFIPDIESTAQAINILLRNGLLDSMPEWMRKKLIRFFQEKQDSKSGYFLDEDPAMGKDEVMVSRAINYSVGSLRKLGSEPLYPLPFELNKAPQYTKTIEAYRKKWESISLTSSWRGCDLLASSCSYIAQMPKAPQKEFVKAASDYLENIQDPETGLWGEGSLYVRISGTFKLHTFYHRHQIPLPRQDKIYESILRCLRTETAEDMCYIRNPINLLSYLQLDIPKGELAEIIDTTITNLEKLKREDGGFSREIGNSPSAPNVAQVKEDDYYPFMPDPVHLSLGLFEGDMNASTQATLIRLQIYELLGRKAGPSRYAANFYPYIEKLLPDK